MKVKNTVQLVYKSEARSWLRGWCTISFNLYEEFRQRRPKGRSSYSPMTGWKDGLCCQFNTQRLSCCTFMGRSMSYFHSTNRTYQRRPCRYSQHPLFPCGPALRSASLLLPVVWLIHVLCNSRCNLVAVFGDVELAAIRRFACRVSAALSPHLLSAVSYM